MRNNIQINESSCATKSQSQLNEFMGASIGTGASIFDPVLCEIAYRWFCPIGGFIIDPFAGGSVRGIVAAALGFNYFGIELRKEQVDANKKQADKIIKGEVRPIWAIGDSAKLLSDQCKGQYDLVFSCPPYADLEIYSDDPSDLSNMTWENFKKAYHKIISLSVGCLKNDRFVVWVVGDVRSKDGLYRNLIGETISAFESSGAGYYNEAILINSIGSLPVRAGRAFSASRKLGKMHQNVLVFVKGDWKKAVEACGDIEVALPDVME